MLLFEIIQTQMVDKKIDQHDDAKLNRSAVDKAIKRRYEQMGAFATYDQHDDKPKEGTKRSLRSNKPEDEGGYQWAKFIAEKGLASENPYFPRVYKIDTTADNSGKITYEIDLEHLKELKDIPLKDVISLWNRMFGEKLVAEVVNDRAEHDPTRIKTDLGAMIRNACYGKIPVKDEHLQKAFDAVNYLRRKNPNLHNDIKANNVMIRRTNYGYQLVITDPLS